MFTISTYRSTDCSIQWGS